MEKIKKKALGDPADVEYLQRYLQTYGILTEKLVQLVSLDDDPDDLREFFCFKVGSVCSVLKNARTAQQLSVAENQINFLTAISKLIQKLQSSPFPLM
jgi:hypothetical protein